MGVKKQHRLVLFLVCLILIGVTVYPHIPALVKVAQAVQGELKFGSTMDQVMTVINKTYYSADVFFGNGAGGTVGVLKGTGNVGIGTITPLSRLDLRGTLGMNDNPINVRAGNDNCHQIGWSASPNQIFMQSCNSPVVLQGSTGNVGIGSTAPTKKLDVVGDINFSGGLYQGGAAFTGSKWTNITGGINYSSGNVGIGTTSPGGALDVNGSFVRNGANTDIRYFGVSRSITQAAGDFVNIGSFSNNGTSNYTKFHLSVHTGCVIQDDEFEVRQLAYLGTSTSWLELPVTHISANHDAIQKYAIDVRVTNQSSTSQAMEARLRVKNATCSSGTIVVDVETNTTFTADTTAGTGATAAGYLGSRNWDFPVSTGTSWNNTTSGLFINNSGNVGIGTTNPTKKLDIVAANSTINNTSGNLSIIPNANLLITQGNVGIGSAAPSQKLDATGNIRTSQWLEAGGAPPASYGGTSGYGLALPSTTNDGIYIIGEHDGGDTSNGVFFSADNTNDGWIFRNSDCCGGGVLDYAKIARDKMFYIGGNVGIGTTGPGYKLDVQGGTINAGSGLYWNGNQVLATNIAGDYQIASSVNGQTGYSQSTLELRESNFGGNTFTPPRLGFHWGGVVASQIAIESDGTIAIRNNPGTGYEKFKSSLITDNASTVSINNYLNVTAEGRPALRVGAAWSISGIYNGSDSVVIGTEPAYNIYLGCYGCGTGNFVTIKGTGGNVGIGVTDPAAKLDINGDLIRTIARGSGEAADGGDGTAQVTGRSFTITKKRADTTLRLLWYDNFRTYAHGNSCRWEIRIDGASCANPGIIAYDKYEAQTSGSVTNNHMGGTLVGICNALAVGSHTISGWVMSSPGYSGADCYTGWQSRWYMEAEEIR